MTDTKKDTAPSVATVDSHGLLSKILKWEESKRGAPALAAWNEIIAHIDAHVAAQVAQLESQNADLRQALSQALSAQAAAPVVAIQENPHFATFPDQIFLQVGDCAEDETSPFDEVYRASDMTWCAESIDRYDVRYIRADLAASQPSPAPVAMTDEQIEQIVRDVTGDYHSDYLEHDRSFYRDLTRAILAAQQEAV